MKYFYRYRLALVFVAYALVVVAVVVSLDRSGEAVERVTLIEEVAPCRDMGDERCLAQITDILRICRSDPHCRELLNPKGRPPQDRDVDPGALAPTKGVILGPPGGGGPESPPPDGPGGGLTKPLEPILEPLEPVLDPVLEPLEPILEPICERLPVPGVCR